MIIPVIVKPNQFARRTIPFTQRFPLEYLCIRTEPKPPSSKRKPRLLGNKRSLPNPIHNTATNISFPNSSTTCIICSWLFPKEMTESEKNTHVNLCLEGKGEKHKTEYIESLLTAHYINNDEQCHHNTHLCPFCGNEYRHNLLKHKLTCVKRFFNNNPQ